MKFVLNIQCGNSAMENYTDIALSLHRLAQELAEQGDHQPITRETSAIKDDNGNVVGHWWIRNA